MSRTAHTNSQTHTTSRKSSKLHAAPRRPWLLTCIRALDFGRCAGDTFLRKRPADRHLKQSHAPPQTGSPHEEEWRRYTHKQSVSFKNPSFCILRQAIGLHNHDTWQSLFESSSRFAAAPAKQPKAEKKKKKKKKNSSILVSFRSPHDTLFETTRKKKIYFFEIEPKKSRYIKFNSPYHLFAWNSPLFCAQQITKSKYDLYLYIFYHGRLVLFLSRSLLRRSTRNGHQRSISPTFCFKLNYRIKTKGTFSV